MNKRLAWVAVVSLSIAAVCGVLAVLASATGWVGGGHRSWAAATRACAAMLWAKKAGTTTIEPRLVDLEWPGSDAVEVNIPARVHYQPGPKAQASISGNAELVSHVRMRDGRLEWDTIVNCVSADNLVVRLTGPAVLAWKLSGSGELDLSNIKQDVLRITVRGSGTVTASGEAKEASLDIAGSSSANLSKLLAQQATAHIRGSAQVDLAPREEVDISISGSAVVRLHGAVARIRSHVSGSGRIIQAP